MMPSTIDHPSQQQGPWNEPSADERTKTPVHHAPPPAEPRYICDICVRPILAGAEGQPPWLHWDPTFDIEWPILYAFDDRNVLKNVSPARNPHQAVPRVFEYEPKATANLTVPKAIPVKQGGGVAV